MDVYFKTIGGAMTALVLCLALSKAGKDYGLLLGTLACCMILAAAAAYLDPVVSFFQELEELIPLDSAMLQILLKTVGISIVGEVAAMICADCGNSALGKAVQLLTGVLILWLALPLLQTLLDMIRQILEAL